MHEPDEPGRAAIAGLIALIVTLMAAWIAFIAWAMLTLSPTEVLNIVAVALMLLGAALIAAAL